MSAEVLCIIIGLFISIFTFKPNKIKNASYTRGKVCAKEYEYIPGAEMNLYFITVRYFVNGIEYYVKSQFRQSYIKDGTKMLLKYNKNNPEECIIIPKISIFMSICFIGFGIYAIISKSR